MTTARCVVALLLFSVTLVACANNGEVSTDMEKSSNTTTAMAYGPALPPAEFCAPKVGTKVQWKNISTNFSWSNTSRKASEPYLVSYFTETGDIRNLYFFCKYCSSSPKNIDLEDYSKLFPLQVGKKIKIQQRSVENPTKTWTHKIAVTGTEMITVQFSESPVPTYVIEEDIWNNHASWKGKVTYWYAPSLGADIKILDHAFDDMEKENTITLISYESP